MIKIYSDTTSSWVEITPNEMTWSLMDISDSDSGRSDTGYMYKNRIGQKRKLEMTFKNITNTVASALLQLINPEYLKVKYPDLMTGSEKQSDMYGGDRTCPIYTWSEDKKIISSLKFSLIER